MKTTSTWPKYKTNTSSGATMLMMRCASAIWSLGGRRSEAWTISIISVTWSRRARPIVSSASTKSIPTTIALTCSCVTPTSLITQTILKTFLLQKNTNTTPTLIRAGATTCRSSHDPASEAPSICCRRNRTRSIPTISSSSRASSREIWRASSKSHKTTTSCTCGRICTRIVIRNGSTSALRTRAQKCLTGESIGSRLENRHPNRFLRSSEAKKSITSASPKALKTFLWTMNDFPLDETSQFADMKILDEKFIQFSSSSLKQIFHRQFNKAR